MLLTVGIGSSVAMVETFLTCLKDQFPIVLKHKEWAALIVCLIFFLLGLPLTTDVRNDIYRRKKLVHSFIHISRVDSI